MNILDILIPVAHAAETAGGEAASGGVLGTLGINWKFFIAQLINFGVVLFVLWKFVFGPVSKKLQERTEKIDTALADAEQIEREKKEFDTWKQEEMGKVRREAAEIVAEAQREASKTREELLSAAKLEQEKMMKQTRAQIAEDENKMLTAVKGEVADMVTKATEKVLKQKMDSATDKKMIKDSLESIK